MKDRKPNLKFFFESYFNKKVSFDAFENISIEKNYHIQCINKREIYVPSNELKLILSFFSDFIFKLLPIEGDVAFAYRKGINVKDCLLPHANSKFFYKTDIINFFPSISSYLIRENIYEDILKLSYLKKDDVDFYLDKILSLVTIDDKLPIGFPTSPFISNYVMRKYDLMLKYFCNMNGFVYTRYSDDIIISSNMNISKDFITRNIDGIFRKEKSPFYLNKSKTKIFTKKHKVKILGLTINNGEISIDREIKNNIEIGIYFFINNREKFINYFGLNELSAKKKLAGNLSYAINTEPDYLLKLVKKYGSSTIKEILRASV
ncbi:reverse transcriptase domain-containing protein [Haemophilus influenzae]|uniref:reverse transcriptase domain-containing protein n=1 Tax=Haemophilus influenzae TaxID=727 RepID=UPI000D0176E8|nr:reverse transcriptase domain-containing protein [Haemophilus influenzae]PRM46126.1 Reverse transcriptase (RNA-dependent DNA polymerase) [Haemophilus influenzae]